MDSWEEVAKLKWVAESYPFGHGTRRFWLSLADRMTDRLLSRHAEPAVAIPDDPSALRPYQRDAVEDLRSRGARTITVDVGLGKAPRIAYDGASFAQAMRRAVR